MERGPSDEDVSGRISTGQVNGAIAHSSNGRLEQNQEQVHDTTNPAAPGTRGETDDNGLGKRNSSGRPQTTDGYLQGGQAERNPINERSNRPTPISPENGGQLPPITSLATFGIPRGDNQNVGLDTIPVEAVDMVSSSSHFCGECTANSSGQTARPLATPPTPGAMTAPRQAGNPAANDLAFGVQARLNGFSRLPPPEDNVATEDGSGNEPAAWEPNGQSVFSGPTQHGATTADPQGYHASASNVTGSQDVTRFENGKPDKAPSQVENIRGTPSC
ncbi:hypothetical protein LOZ66_006832 [Ophidiomyces ophidiicola]|nr:hypothetical protein LOZ66_006832 [Ophidiomyces ophidiicola]